MTCPKCGSNDINEMARNAVTFLGMSLPLPLIVASLATGMVLTCSYAMLLLPMLIIPAADRISARCRACGFEIKGDTSAT